MRIPEWAFVVGGQIEIETRLNGNDLRKIND
jgi:hypothetical protein